jgi:predicted MFS family arabinose efflux permease
MATGSAATEAPPHSMISDMVPPEKRASAISLFMLGVPVAAILGSFAGGAIAQNYGWRATFLVFGALGVLVSLLCFAFLKEPERKSAGSTGTTKPGTLYVIGVMARSKTIIFITLGACFISFASFGVNTFLPLLLQRVYGLDTAKAGLTFGLISGIASMVGTLAGGYASEYLAKRDPRWLLGFPALGSFIGAPLFIIGLSSNSLALAVPLMLIGCFSFYTAMGPCIATLHGSLDSYTRATGSALFLLIMHLFGQGFGPPLAGFFSDLFSTSLYAAGQFETDCAGAAGQIPGSACAAASATGLRYAVMTFAAFHFVAGTLLYFAARAANPNKRKYYG